ncbi:hypothetical protein pdul_cds_795 [Pandoravirus dulcis]|uniref:Uncharacterized protein n=1 Tax=Pandoravirus dulcis TaxID=1349409 RepID=S4VRU0_9VIRU|nr:hypothetical protein pdul_cds_795 [Pandoravirus dulcis]AGO82992.1 hypothetical protein pdul_cds_795 [Pandoravirus dulcis]
MSTCIDARPHRESVHCAASKTSAVAIACCVGDACALDVLHALSGMKEAAADVRDKSLDTWIDAARRVDERIAEIVAEDATLLCGALALEPQQKADAEAVVSARDTWYGRLGDAWHDARYSASEIDRTLGALDDLASAASAVLDENVLGALQDEAKAWREARHVAAMAPAVDRLAKRLEAAVETLGGIVDASAAIRDTYTLMRSNSFGHIMAALVGSPQHSAVALVFACLMDDIVGPGLNIIDVMDRAIERVCLPAACAVADDSPTD